MHKNWWKTQFFCLPLISTSPSTTPKYQHLGVGETEGEDSGMNFRSDDQMVDAKDIQILEAEMV